MGFCHLSMLSYPQRLECQNKFRIDTQSRWASDNPPLRDIASNNKGRVGNLDHQSTLRRGQSFRTGHNMPFNSTPQFRNLVHHRNIGMLTLGTFHAILL